MGPGGAVWWEKPKTKNLTRLSLLKVSGRYGTVPMYLLKNNYTNPENMDEDTEATFNFDS